MAKSVEALRAALASTDRSGAGRPYPLALRREVVAYVEARRGQGVGPVAASRELGVSAFSVARWTAAIDSRVESGFREVVLAERSEVVSGSASTRLVVHGPHGLRIEGLDVAAVAELWRRLL